LDHIARSGSKIVITARAGHHLQQGQPDIAKILERRIITALGTDGIPSVDSLSLWDEMRAFVEYNQYKYPLTGQQVLSMVTTHAAMVLGLQEEIGSLEKGKTADVLVVDISSVPTQGDLLMNLIKRVRDYNVEQVLIGGQVVKSVN
jgi:5-methylthioadenosine/S-adenosylhomocysteine deaminase